MRRLYCERAMCEIKAKKDAPAAVFSRAACVSRAPPADASRRALSGWDTPGYRDLVSSRQSSFDHFLFLFVSLVPVSYRPTLIIEESLLKRDISELKDVIFKDGLSGRTEHPTLH